MSLAVPYISPVPPTEAEQLRISGLSLVFYNFYLLEDADKSEFGTTESLLEVINIPNHYNVLFDFGEQEKRAYSTYRYTKPLVVKSITLPNAGEVSGEANLFFQRINRFILATTIINVDYNTHIFDDFKLMISRPLTVEDVYALISELNRVGGSFYEEFHKEKADAATRCFGTISRPLSRGLTDKNIGIQIWDIDNYDLSNWPEITGLKLTTDFAWEIAALLEVNSDLMRVYGRWRDRRIEQIQSLVGHGTDVIADHRILINRSVCLEIVQLQFGKLTERVLQRLSFFRYDSTSIYLWGLLAFLEFALEYYTRFLSDMLYEASHISQNTEEGNSSTYPSFGPDMLSTLIASKSEIFFVLDKLYWLTTHMVEKRHSDFFSESSNARGLDGLRSRVEQKLDELTSLATDIHQVFLNLDQRNIMADLRTLNQSSEDTKRGIELLNFVIAATQAAVLSDYITELIPRLNTPIAKGLIGLGLFSFAIVLFTILNRLNEKKP